MTQHGPSVWPTVSRRRFLQATGLTGLALAGGSALASCGGNGGSEGSDRGAIELTVSNWPSLMYAVPWAVALQHDLYKEHGIDLEGYVGSSGGGTTVRNVVTGGIPLGSVATPASINAYEAGAPLKIVGASIGTTADINFVTLPDRGIQGIEGLRGKRVGFTNPGSATHACIVLSLEAAGIDLGEVKLQAMGGLSESHTALKEGVIDAAPHALPTFLMQESEGWETVFWTNEYIDFMQLSLIAGAPVIGEDAEFIDALVSVYAEACEQTIDDPARAAEAWSANSEVPQEFATRSLEMVDLEPYFTTALSVEGLNTSVDAMKATETLDTDVEVDWEGMIDQQFIPEASRIDIGQLK